MPNSINIGPLTIHFYALAIIAGILAGLWLLTRRARNRGLDTVIIDDGFFWALIPGLIGARLYHVLTPSPASQFNTAYYMANPLQIFAVWNGGLGIYGAIIGGLAGISIYAIRRKQPLLLWLDLIVPSMALGQAVGRWGNFFNQELYGAPVSWGIYIDPVHRLPGYVDFERFHPLFLYESLWCLITAILLAVVHHRLRDRLRNGDVFLLYIMSYATIRFLLDFLRLDSHRLASVSASLTTAQIISLVAFIVAGAIILVRRRLRPASLAAQ
jgi:phosphatidylglycerol---prolipoprotein diacylglyceryl transferase